MSFKKTGNAPIISDVKIPGQKLGETKEKPEEVENNRKKNTNNNKK